MKNLSLLCITLLLIQLTGCKNESESVVNKDNDSIHYNKTIRDITIDDIVNVTPDFQIQYEIIKIEDLSYLGVDRRRGKISVPSGLSKKGLIQNIYHSIKTIYNTYHSDGISIWIYARENDGQIGNYMGSAEFAPYGDWGKVDSNLPLEEYLVRLDIQYWYYNPKEKQFEPQKKQVKSHNGVEISRTSSSSSYSKQWFKGGNLHKATVAQWKGATHQNKLATAADWLASTIWEGYLISPDDFNKMKVKAQMLVNAVDGVVTVKKTDYLKVTELAAAIIIMSNDLGP